MGLTSALNLGRSALTASSVGIQVTGNNFANAATTGYSRQLVGLAPAADARDGRFLVGRGVDVRSVRRQVDEALQARLRNGVAQEAAANTDLRLLSQVQATLNELTDADLSSELGRFFGSWSELANAPAGDAARSVVGQRGEALAGFVRQLRTSLVDQRVQIDRELASTAVRANDLLAQVAALNTAIVNAEGGSATANSLRDQRDVLVNELSSILDVSVVEQASGAFDIHVGSTPVVLAGHSRGVEFRTRTVDGEVEAALIVSDTREVLPVQAGAVGSLLAQRATLVDDTLARLDSVASQLIFEVNRVHSSGFGTSPLTSVTGTRSVGAGDVDLAMNDPANATFADLPFRAQSGSFLVTVRHAATGSSQTVRITVDLDGRTSAGLVGTDDDTSVEDLRTALDAIDNLSATVNGSGQLRLEAAAGYEIGLAEDSSGVLAVLGVNTFFTGDDASDIGVRRELLSQPGLIAAGRTVAGQPVENGAALAIAGLRSTGLAALGGVSIGGAWDQAVQAVGVRADSAKTVADAATLVRESLESQHAAVSGVSLDEESMNLVTFQRQYQGAARFISVVDELTQTLIGIL